jgi:hypothetical protein
MAALLACTGAVWADGGVEFHNVSIESGIDFQREPSPERRAIWEAHVAASPFPNAEQGTRQANSPQKQNGAPGIALFDYDNDGDLDIYAPNGPGADNALFQNQLAQTGEMEFVDVASSAGVTAFNQDSNGVCVGDTDNDGDQDLYVVAAGHRNLFFRNNGNGTFTNTTMFSKLPGYGRNASGCAMGDVNGDGLLDIVVANTYDDWKNRQPVFIGQGITNLQPNELYLNKGNNVFQDVSLGSGILNIISGPPSIYFGGSYTWAISMIDYDQDGDTDIMWADTQGAPPADKSQERSALRLFENNGAGQFTDVTHARGLAIWGSWMGLSFGDFNRDGAMDVFGTNFGRYMGGVVQNSRWLLGSANKSFTDPQVGDLVGTPFGWGTTVLDYDNDGDQDISFFGDDDVLFFWAADNPGTLLRNDGNANFIWDRDAMTTDHRQRQVQGAASGDLNGDGFEDIVTISTYGFVASENFRPFTQISGVTGSPFDDVARFENVFTGRITAGFTTYLNPAFLKGDVALDLNSGGNGNGSVQFDLVGAKGLVSNRHAAGRVNRDGVGAVVKFTPAGDATSLQPITAGSSYGSTDSMTAHFGLGEAATGVVEVLWPGGVRNRLYDVKAGEHLTLPEIPCSFDGNSNRNGFRRCTNEALKDLVRRGVINQSYSNRLSASALRAYDAAH